MLKKNNNNQSGRFQWPRVVVTGMGVVSPLGIGTEANWSALIGGKSGAGPITRFDSSRHKTHFACEVKNFDPTDFMDRKTARRMDLFCQFAMAAAVEAIESANLQPEKLDCDRAGVIVGSGIGGMTTYENQVEKLIAGGPSRISPFFIPMLIGDIAAGHISIRWNLKGPNYGVQSACSTASHAIGTSVMHLLLGDADVMVCGGAEAPLNAGGVAGFNSMNALSTRNDDPQAASRPFDRDRDGFVMGEGGAIFVLETEEHALRRGAEILAEVAGYGFTGDAYHLTAPLPDGSGAVRSMKAAIRCAGLEPGDIQYINAHGTSTSYNDSTETLAIKAVFGEKAYEIPISSTKSMTGHQLGAAGAMELFSTVQTVRTGVIPPTINLDNPDPECDLNYVPNKAIKRDVQVGLSNTFGFGGHNASLMVRRWKP